jgi:hypothetical protein
MPLPSGSVSEGVTVAGADRRVSAAAFRTGTAKTWCLWIPGSPRSCRPLRFLSFQTRPLIVPVCFLRYRPASSVRLPVAANWTSSDFPR